MVVVSYSGKEINAKLVYYGAGLSGKTTNLESIYEAVPDTSRGKMVSMKTQSDRTLFFDLLPLDLGEIMGFKTRFLLYTVPGQVFYNATRKLVLKGADAIVFVADSEVGKMEENKESLANLHANLAEYGLDLEQIPWVMQYNKRDLPNVYTLDELNAELNPGGKVPFFEAVATQGKGVFETFRGISHMLMEKVTRDLRRGPASRSAPAQNPSAAPPAAANPLLSPTPPQATAAPQPAGRAIEQEAKATEPVGGAVDDSIDYGREIDLPGSVPATPLAQDAPAAAGTESRAMAGAPAKQPSAPRSDAAPAAKASTEAKASAAPPAPAKPEAQASAPAPPKPNAPPPSTSPAKPEPARPAGNGAAASAAAPKAEPQPAAKPAAAAPKPPAPAVEASVEPIVVPVKLPKGSSREIVLKIVIQVDET